MALMILAWWNKAAGRGLALDAMGRAIGFNVASLTLSMAEWLVARHSKQYEGTLVDIRGEFGSRGGFIVDSVDLPVESECVLPNGTATPESEHLWTVYQRNSQEQALKRRID